MPNEFGVPDADYNLLLAAADAEGMDLVDMLEDAVIDSVVPGICSTCRGTQGAEPDARSNYCDQCETRTVCSVLDLAGII
jgi:hypothetical protein